MFKILIQTTIAKESFEAIIDKIPECPSVTERAGGTSSIPGTKRRQPEPWGIAPLYIDAEGKEEVFSSPSDLIKHLGLPMSGTICDAEGKKCRAATAVEILRISGYTVSGNGEPRKASAGGKKLTVYHPDALKEEK